MMGDTAVEWAIHIAELAYMTRAFFPRSELMRVDITKSAFEIVRKYYQPSLTWESFWEVITETIKQLQEKEKGEFVAQKTGGLDNPEHLFNRTIDSLFDVTYKYP